MPDKDRIAEELIDWHFQVEPGLVRVYRVIADNEDAPEEPIKLLEVNTHTVSTGEFSAFGFAPTKDVPFPTVIAEVTPDELEALRRKGAIPEGWDLRTARTYDRPAA
jgi:hypothetical protein